MKEIIYGFVAEDGKYFSGAFECTQYETKRKLERDVIALIPRCITGSPGIGVLKVIDHITQHYYLTPKEPTIG